MKLNFTYLLLIISSFSINSQTTYEKILWNKSCNCPVQFATINYNENYSISNKDGFFSITSNSENVEFNMLGYEKLKINLNKIKNDTIYVNSKPFELDEIILNTESFFKSMVKTINIDYALEPHIEEFYLRAILKKNNEIVKIIDLSGKIKKQTLFNTESKPMPKKNYSVQVEHIRKAGKIFRDYDFTIINFKNLINKCFVFKK
jgi:hypothetical protein